MLAKAYSLDIVLFLYKLYDESAIIATEFTVEDEANC